MFHVLNFLYCVGLNLVDLCFISIYVTAQIYWVILPRYIIFIGLYLFSVGFEIKLLDALH